MVCKHTYVYNKIIDFLRRIIKYEITCSKCGYRPPEGYVPDERTKGNIKVDIKDIMSD